MNNSIKRAQSRAGSIFAEPENFRPKVKQLKRKLMMTLVALLAVTTGAWADTWDGGTFTASSDLTIENAVIVSTDATLTIEPNVAVTINYLGNDGDNCITIKDGAKLTVTGGGTLIVNGNGSMENGSHGIYAENNNSFIVDGATVQVRGGNGGSTAAGGWPGGNGFYNVNIVIKSGSIVAIGGKGGDREDASEFGVGGEGIGGNNVGSLTVYGGTVTAQGGANGSPSTLVSEAIRSTLFGINIEAAEYEMFGGNNEASATKMEEINTFQKRYVKITTPTEPEPESYDLDADPTGKIWTLEKMLPGNVMLMVDLYELPELAWMQGETKLPEENATVYKCEGFAFTMPTLDNPHELTGVTFASDNEQIATVDNDGVITITAQQGQEGQATITATFDEDDTYEGQTVSFTLVIGQPYTLNVTAENGTVTVEGASKGDAAGAVYQPQDYTSLTDGMVLHVGDTFVLNGNNTEVNGWGIALDVPVTVIRAKEGAGCYEPDANGSYYAISQNGSCQSFTNLKIEGNSDGIKVKFDGFSNNKDHFSLSTNFPEATSNAIDNGDGTYTVIPNSEITLKATANEGFHFVEWSDNVTADTDDETVATIKLEQTPTNVTATFAENEYEVTFLAKNKFTIKGGKAKVFVGETDMTSSDDLTHNTDGSESTLKKVKTGQTVKLKANQGYKLRKVDAKKTVKTLTITDDEEFTTILDIAGCTTWDEVITKNSTQIRKDGGNIWDAGNDYILNKGQQEVNVDDTFDPNATDYVWKRAY